MHLLLIFFPNLIQCLLILSKTSFSPNFFLFGLKGECPWIISYKRIPKLHTSISLLYPLCSINSGDMYSVVPQNVFLVSSLFILTHQPKSHSFTKKILSFFLPVLNSKIFSGFISRWIKSFLCRKLTAFTTWIKCWNDCNSFKPFFFLI